MLKQIAQDTKFHQKLKPYVEHYLDIYENYFQLYNRFDRVKLLEIGVNKGGSLSIWQNYFPNGEIHGIDIKDNRQIKVGMFHLGNQLDIDFLKRIADVYGPFDFIIDDGGHTTEQQTTSFNTLFKYSNIYVIEDTCVAYWKNRNSRYNIFDYLFKLVHKMHRIHQTRLTPWSDEAYFKAIKNHKNEIEWIHFYNSIVFIKRSNNV